MKKLWLLLHIPFLATVLFSAWFFFFPFSSIKFFFDSLSVDKELETFTISLYETLVPIILVFGIISLFFLLFSFLFSEKSQKLLKSILIFIKTFPKRLKDDAQLFWILVKRYITQDKDWIYILVLMLGGAVLRGIMLDRPMTHDESYTYLAFISSGLGNIISDYHLPNNHILYSIFGYFSTQILGNSPWALRFPAFVAGVLMIPASYFASRIYFNRQIGLLTGSIVTTVPVFLLYTTLARGYAQLTFFSILLWLLGSLVLKRKNLFIWFLFILVAAAGFYTIPIMVYPFTGVMAWLFFAWVFGEYDSVYSREDFFKYLFLAGAMVVILFVLLYLPAFIKTGFKAIFANSTIEQFQVKKIRYFFYALRTKTIFSWQDWHQNLGTIARFFSLFGVILALIKHHKITKKHANYFLATLFAIILTTALQKAVGYVRLWFFFAPIYFSFAAAGLVYLLKTIELKEKIISLTILIFILFSFGNTIFWLKSDTPEIRELRGVPGSVEKVARFLSEEMDEKGAYTTAMEYRPTLTYYALYYGIPLSHAHSNNNEFTYHYALLTSPDEKLVENLHGGMRDRVDIDEAVLVYSEGDFRIYKIPVIIFY